MSGPLSEADPADVVDEAAPSRRRRWPWIAGCIAGLAVGAIFWVVLGFLLWFEAGGTLGGYGESASARVDRDELLALRARWEWAPVVVTFAVPTVWAWRWSRGEGEGAKSARRVFYALAATAVVLAAWSPARLLMHHLR